MKTGVGRLSAQSELQHAGANLPMMLRQQISTNKEEMRIASNSIRDKSQGIFFTHGFIRLCRDAQPDEHTYSRMRAIYSEIKTTSN